MPRRKSQYSPPPMPRHAELVRHYTDLGDYLNRFICGNIHLLVIIGPRGTGKSMAVEKSLTAIAATNPTFQVHHQNCPGTAWSFYLMLVENAYKSAIVLNEANALFRDQRGRDLLKTVTELRSPVLVQWGFSVTSAIQSGEVPAEFWTSARFCIIANSWPEDNADLQAIQSRSTMVYLNPSASEMHRYAGTWYAGRKDVYEFMGKHLAECVEPDLRYYDLTNRRAEWAQRKGRPDAYWQDYVLSLAFVGEKRIVWQLMNDESFSSHRARGQEFARLIGAVTEGAGIRRYYRLYNELKDRMDNVGDTTNDSCQTVTPFALVADSTN